MWIGILGREGVTLIGSSFYLKSGSCVHSNICELVDQVIMLTLATYVTVT